MVGAVVAGVVSLGAGVLLGLAFAAEDRDKKWRRFLEGLTRAIVPLVIILGAAGVIAGLVAIAEGDGNHDVVWGQVIAVVFLFEITLLLYATGMRRRTAGTRIDQMGKITIEAGAKVSEEAYAGLAEDNKPKVSRTAKATIVQSDERITLDEGAEVSNEIYSKLSEQNRAQATRRAKVKIEQGSGSEKITIEPGGKVSGEIYEKLTPANKDQAPRIATKKIEQAPSRQAVTLEKDTDVSDEDYEKLSQENRLQVQRRAKEKIEQGSGEDRITVDLGAEVSAPTYRKLTNENKATVERQRGLYFRALYVGADGRWSTSKLQALLWTYVVLFGLIAIFVADQLGGSFLTETASKTNDFGGLKFRQEYLLLLGGPFAAAVLAKGIMASRVENGEVVKPAAPTDRGALTGLRDVISDDGGNADLVDLQYFLFNGVALAFVLTSLIPDLEDGFPKIPDFLVGLTSASALTYVTKKAVERSTPQITRVIPAKAFPKQIIRIQGRYLVAPPALAPTVTIDGREAANVTVRNAGESDDAEVDVTLPAALATGRDKGVEVLPPGATAPATSEIEIVGLSVTRTDPDPLPLRTGIAVTIEGEGFGGQEGTVELGDKPLDKPQWSEQRITATIRDLPSTPPTSVPAVGQAAASETLPLVITRSDKQGEPLTHQVAISRPKPEITTVNPAEVRLEPNAPVVVDGREFGQKTEESSLRLGQTELVVDPWSPERLTAHLPQQYKVDTPGSVASAELPLVVTNANGESGIKMTPVAAVKVTDAQPKPLPVKAGQEVRISGSGFGAAQMAPAAISLDNKPLTVTSWSDALITATVPEGLTLAAGEGRELRVVNPVGYAATLAIATAAG